MKEHKMKYLITIAVAVLFLLGCNYKNEGIEQKDTKEEAQIDVKIFADAGLPMHAEDEQVIQHKSYILSYSEYHELSRWVAYKLNKEQTKGARKSRYNFIIDPKVKTKSAADDDYVRSGYTRGHLVPAGDMKWDDASYKETFYMSNVSPQARAFNTGIWNELEQQIRKWSQDKGELYVVTGPVLEKRMTRIGKNRVGVPDQFWKVILTSGNDPKAIAFLMMNEGSRKPVMSFAVSIDSIETLTGIDLFSGLEDILENKLEAAVDTIYWN